MILELLFFRQNYLNTQDIRLLSKYVIKKISFKQYKMYLTVK